MRVFPDELAAKLDITTAMGMRVVQQLYCEQDVDEGSGMRALDSVDMCAVCRRYSEHRRY